MKGGDTIAEKIGAGAFKAFLRTGLKELQNVFSLGSTVGNEPGSLGTPTIQQVDREIRQDQPRSNVHGPPKAAAAEAQPRHEAGAKQDAAREAPSAPEQSSTREAASTQEQGPSTQPEAAQQQESLTVEPNEQAQASGIDAQIEQARQQQAEQSQQQEQDQGLER